HRRRVELGARAVGGRVMSSGAAEFEALLREALSPVDPPEDLSQRMELTLVNLTELAQEELEAWELSAMRDPRNWVRPAAAVVVGGSAGVALVLLRARRRARPEAGSLLNARTAAERAVGDLREHTRRLLGDR
ncbi:MAG TPA: hypothetical protein VFV03_06925, partial [Solirubrobacteraceae bacterium]|nr:hypothetical protein [Solirubrobacteraceae bacterium]